MRVEVNELSGVVLEEESWSVGRGEWSVGRGEFKFA
jgi:hypothetical protein